MRLVAIALAAMLLAVACSSPGPDTPTATPAPSPALALHVDLSTASPSDVDALRKLAFDYWDAFNSYDVDTVLAFLEPSYRQERESTIRSDIGRLKLFRVKLGLSEETPPTLAGPDDGEMYLTMKEPTGTRRIHMSFKRREGGWHVTYAQEVQ